jgi:hypothetical protein
MEQWPLLVDKNDRPFCTEENRWKNPEVVGKKIFWLVDYMVNRLKIVLT